MLLFRKSEIRKLKFCEVSQYKKLSILTNKKVLLLKKVRHVSNWDFKMQNFWFHVITVTLRYMLNATQNSIKKVQEFHELMARTSPNVNFCFINRAHYRTLLERFWVQVGMCRMQGALNLQKYEDQIQHLLVSKQNDIMKF